MIPLIGVIFTLFTIFTYYAFSDEVRQKFLKPNAMQLAIIAVAAFIFRIALSSVYSGHETDMLCFSSWADTVYSGGFGAFYSPESFSDYPPGYMYILYVIGFLRSFGFTSEILLKLPSVICDILSAVVLYRLSMRENNRLAVIICAFYLFNPAVILNSAVWGQVDSVFTLFAVLTLYLLYTKKLKPAYFAFALSVFIKPQALFYTPILLFAMYEQIFKNKPSAKKIISNIACGISAILLILALCIPFGIMQVFNQYKSTIASYNYASVNAYNLWTALGLNWHELNPLTSAAGYIFILLTVSAAGITFFSKKQKNRYFLTSAFICFSVFMLSVKMHDRYAYPSIILMLCSFAVSCNKKELFLYTGISALQFFNAAHVLFYYTPDTYYSGSFITIAVLLSIISLILLFFFAKYLLKDCFKKYSAPPIPTNHSPKITRTDKAAMLAITLLYSIIALYNLGNMHAPKTDVCIKKGSEAVIKLDGETYISKMKFYLGPRELSESRPLYLTLCDSENNVVYESAITDGSVFCINYADIEKTAQFIYLSADEPVYLNETALIDADGNFITPQSFPSRLFDEQSELYEYQSFKNGTYFDEIYHVRTAYEFINNMEVYEWTHPPMGKIFISLGIRLFGMTPFGWRIIGTLFGIMMIPIIYLTAKKMFGVTWISVCTASMLAVDFMHFTQSRIATIDVYVTFFIMLMYLFMYKYYTMSFFDTSLKKTFLPLGACGIAFGLACACKWTGLYAGAGVAVIFFITLFERYLENQPEFKTKTIKTLLFCTIFFIAVPLVIYTLSYIPYLKSNHESFAGIIQNQIDMLTYHGKTVVSSEHPFSSPWYQWPVIYRPIWYFSGTDGIKTEDISAMGNPAVWWLGIISFFFCVKNAKKDRNARFLIIAYLAQLLPWVFVTRTTFIYHYFPAVPFVILMNAYMFFTKYGKNKRFKNICFIFTIFAAVLFAVFYPAISGYPVKSEYLQLLRLFPSWQLTK